MATQTAAAVVATEHPVLMQITTEFMVKAYYHELPNKNAAIAAAVIFAAVSAALFATTVKTRAWFMLTAVLTGLLEVAGYCLRIQMLSKPEFNTYVVSYAFLVIAPVLLAIVEYISVGKLIKRSKASTDATGGGSTAFAKCVSWFMGMSEIVCLGLQCAAAGPLTSHDEHTRNTGRQMMLTGLCLQLGFFTAFTGIVMYVHLSAKFGYNGSKKFRAVFLSLYATIGMIFIRNIFRVVEFAQGFDGYLATHEAFFYGFDFSIIIAVLLVFAVFNYGFYFQDAKLQLPSQQPMSPVSIEKAVQMGGRRTKPVVTVSAMNRFE